MGDMTDLNDLKKRKEKLLLEQEVARLERKQQLSRTASNWRWWWVAPLGALGAFLIASATHPAGALLGIAGMIPAALKVYFGR